MTVFLDKDRAMANVQEHNICRKPPCFTDEAWSSLCGYINVQNKRHWKSINPRQMFEVPFYDRS